MNKEELLKLKGKIIAVDFDGTLCEYVFPGIGAPKFNIINLVKELSKNNDLILWTCRRGYALKQAFRWCDKYGLKFNKVNKNVDWAYPTSRKVFAHYYLDDKAINVEDL